MLFPKGSLLENLAKCCGSDSTTIEKDQSDSVQSEDSGGRERRDLNEGDFDDTSTDPTPTFTRRNGFKTTKRANAPPRPTSGKTDAFPGGSPGRRHTARVVVLGDDRVLGTLSRAYRSIR